MCVCTCGWRCCMCKVPDSVVCYECMYVCMHIWIRLCMRVCTCGWRCCVCKVPDSVVCYVCVKYVCMYVWMYVCMKGWMCVRMYEWKYVGMYACVCMCRQRCCVCIVPDSFIFCVCMRYVSVYERMYVWLYACVYVQPIADRVTLNLEIISKNFKFTTKCTNVLMRLIIYYMVLIVNPMGQNSGSL